MGLKDILSNRTETAEKHHLEQFKTRYYKTTKSKALSTIKAIIEADDRMEILDYLEDLGEINVQILKPKKAFMVISIITVFPYRTAVDLTVVTQTGLPLDFGYSKTEVLELYKKIEKHLEFIGTSLSGDLLS
jgi:hypothetical protein